MVSVTRSSGKEDSKQQIDIADWLASLEGRYPEKGLEVIRRACDLAQRAHSGQTRVSGEPYIQHSLAVADILSNIRMDYETVAAAILHDVVEDTKVSLDEIRRQFGNSISGLVDGVTKMMVIQTYKGLEEPSKKEKKERVQAESLRKMLLAMAEDIRVVLIKLADRTHNMRTLGVLPEYKQRRIANETLEIYAPLANRLGIWQLKWELEDLSFRYLEPALYKKIARMLDERRVDREKYIKDFLKTIENELQKVHVEAAITGRPKHIYSIYRKMKLKNIDYHQVYDTRGVRVLVDTIPECYTVLGIVHSLWSHIPGEFDDYIATPKQNNYQSIHTAVFGPDGKVVEVQIRTHKMHQDNELGVAAHWRYKEGAEYDAGFERKINWLRQLLDWKEEVADAGEFVDQFKSDAFEDRIYVFTPKGNVVDLPEGATPLDFAYHIHTEVGHRCRGAKVNGHMVPLTYRLKTGEQIDILTVKRGEPSRDWLNPDLGYLGTSRARSKVMHWFKMQNFDNNVDDGRTFLEKELNRLGQTDINYEKLARQLDYPKVEDFLAALGRNDLKISRVVRQIQQINQGEQTQPVIQTRAPQAAGGGDVTIHGVGDLLTQIAKCCKPVPGDEIAGYITKGRGITIHRKDCSNILRYINQSPERLIDVEWSNRREQQVYPVDVQIRAFDRQGLLRDVAALLSNESVNIIAVNTQSDKKSHTANMLLTMEVNDLNKLSKILYKINSLPNVLEVRRKR
jgi:GTP pyrophosphokinase